MKRLLFAAAFALTPLAAEAACFGSDTYRTCTDSSGNNYSIQRYGGTTRMQGYNSQTGSSWSQNTMRYGNGSSTYGTDSYGRSWSQQRYGRSYSGTDASGNFYSGYD